jgi:hypothetical protein
MASFRQAMVRWMYDFDSWQCGKSRNKYSVLYVLDMASLNVRSGFVAFDTYKSLLADSEGRVSGPGTVIAGFGAGCTESLLAVTPFESIKTQM